MLLASRNQAMSRAWLATAARVRKACAAWARIYGGPEVAGLLAAAGAFGVVHAAGGPLLGSALLGSWAEDIAFVGYFAVRAVRAESQRHKHHHWLKYCLLSFGIAVTGLFIELGPAEVIDKVVRPALFYSVPLSVHMHDALSVPPMPIGPREFDRIQRRWPIVVALPLSIM